MFTQDNFMKVANFVGSTSFDNMNRFKTARENAKVAGKLLAHFLVN